MSLQTFFPLQKGQPLPFFLSLIVAGHSWPFLHFHQTIFPELGVTTLGVSTPFLLGCHCCASLGLTASRLFSLLNLTIFFPYSILPWTLTISPDRIHRVGHSRESSEMRTLGVIGPGIEPLPAPWTFDDSCHHEHLGCPRRCEGEKAESSPSMGGRIPLIPYPLPAGIQGYLTRLKFIQTVLEC